MRPCDSGKMSSVYSSGDSSVDWALQSTHLRGFLLVKQILNSPTTAEDATDPAGGLRTGPEASLEAADAELASLSLSEAMAELRMGLEPLWLHDQTALARNTARGVANKPK